MALHKSLAIGDIHIPYQWSYADSTARGAATGFVVGDVGKLARQLDNNSLWTLTNHSPIAWKSAAEGGTPAAHASTHQNSGGDEVATATAAANAIPKAGAGGKLDVGWVPTGSSSTTVCIGDDSRLSNARTPTSHASSHNSGGGDALAIDAASGTGSLRTLGTAATAACAGNDSRLSDARTPTSHASSHNSGGGDALAIDAVAGTGSLRTLGTAATSACAGNDARLSDNRTDSNAIHKTTSAEISALTEKTTLASADVFVLEDSAASYAKKKVQVANFPAGVDVTAIHKTTAAEISAMTEKTVPVDADWAVIEDSAASNAKKKIQLVNIPGTGLYQTLEAHITSDTTTTSNVWVDLLTVNITTGSRKLKIGYSTTSDNSNNGKWNYFTLDVDGVEYAGGGATVGNGALACACGQVYISVTAAAHVVKLRWCTSANTGRITPSTAHHNAWLIVQEVE